ESDKATMEVPSPFAGTVRELKVKVGDTLSEGGVVALIEAAEAGADADAAGDAGSGSAASAPKAGGDAGGEERAQPEADAKTTPAAETGTRVQPVAVPEAADNIAQASIDHQAGVASAEDTAPPRRFDADALLPGKVP